jgi:hypothetical protein
VTARHTADSITDDALDALYAERDRLAAEVTRLTGQLSEYADRAIANGRRAEQAEAALEDQRKAHRTAAEAADRFRDILCEALGHPDENPGDDTLVNQIRAHFGKTGPEPTTWRDRLTGYEATRDQINAAALDDTPPDAAANHEAMTALERGEDHL